jgi:hypothetical protein
VIQQIAASYSGMPANFPMKADSIRIRLDEEFEAGVRAVRSKLQRVQSQNRSTLSCLNA